MQHFEISENGLNLVIQVSDDLDVRLLHFSTLPYDANRLGGTEALPFYRLYELQVSGYGRMENHGLRYIQNCPGIDMKFKDLLDTRTAEGRKIEVITAHETSGLEVSSFFQFYDGLSLARCWQEIRNTGTEPQGIEYISSFSLTGLSKEGLGPDDETLLVHTPFNGWQGELQWDKSDLSALGLRHMSDAGNSTRRIQQTGVGGWSSGESIPMAMLENTETCTTLFWQIETNGGWHWEISDVKRQLVLNISGPSDIEHHWWKRLLPGDRFESIKACVGSVMGSVDAAAQQLTLYRRRIRRPCVDNRRLPVIFNDYMNCLWASPTTEKELPMIRAAADIGCEYYVVDAGWYTDGDWWANVGEWLPSKKRFPGGLKEVMDAIRAKGMIPGIWLEIEVMGVNCPKLIDTDDSWFFMRHGKRVMDSQRYQMDFSSPKVQAYATEVVRRVVEDYGVGYIKIDYNINAGVGTETGSDSLGDGLLRHQRAYLNWLDGILRKYPDVTIENCSSGGMRMDYAMLSRCALQSTSDQSDFRKYAIIAANAPTAVTPEQSAIWSYPLNTSTREEIIFNIVNSLLQRIHQSGNMDSLTAENRELVREGLAYYKQIRSDIPEALPFWPRGLCREGDEWACMGLATSKKRYIAVWHIRGSKSFVALPVAKPGDALTAAIRFPAEDGACRYEYCQETGVLSVVLPQAPMARVIELTTK